ncbi:TetR family transcriptional regulator [Halanaerobium saccharolyticum]|uniref:TetR family transcriptional regulator n=1 Tax=Halanaerobium saccharolyticum TaxID=43595 RepID=A0A4R7YUW0_9FIRM|nr:TetR/AcrR family transcriptional regulator [Halanaerobium saccharolyticum]RAK05356.1 TetR family transcriptional regulator [Halanaerobium saccharolyticum]TDV99714.1 TetR family transcriptional regulator [Halanaerobium saccharolyticum]TDX51871.1 TetR family transcriptional regulator [Halanaerobium saccharolyticum]
MPKIIKNLEEEIAKTALELFNDNPYQNVSMREIASEVGIAVGTLYNYYPNKWELYINVFEESWRETYQILKNNCQQLDENHLMNYLKVLTEEMKKKKSIVRELFRYIMNDLEIGEEEQKEKFNRIRFPEVLINQIYELFVSVLKKEFKIELEKNNTDLYRLFTMIQTDIPLLQQNFEKEDDNLQFLYDIISSYVVKKFNA